jgi:hypothetical protein
MVVYYEGTAPRGPHSQETCSIFLIFVMHAPVYLDEHQHTFFDKGGQIHSEIVPVFCQRGTAVIYL